MTLINWTFFSMSAASLISLMRNRFHLLIVLLSLETLMLSLTLQMLSLAFTLNFHYTNAMVILCFSACEASMGLALLVSLIRARGNDSMKALTLQKF